MYTGIALYGTERATAQDVLSLGVSIFASLGLSIVKCGYNQYLKNGDHKGDHDFIEVSLSELVNDVAANKISSFRLYDEREKFIPWFASFGLSTNDFGGFHHVDIQLPILTNENVDSVIQIISSSILFDYGIVYACDKASKAFYYSAGDNLVSIYPFENPSLFKKETPGRFNGHESYRHSKLRMVYPFNLINRHHLDIQIYDVSLETWIIENNVGNLNKINDALWCWAIDEKAIEHVNIILGDANVLVSWKQSFSKKPVKKLP